MASSSSPSSASPDLLTCSPKELSEYLYHHRFDKDATKTKNFFMDAAASSAPVPNEAEDDTMNNMSTTTPLRSPVSMSCLAPRGKFQITLYGGDDDDENQNNSNDADLALVATNAKNQRWCIGSNNAVERLICYPRPEDCRQRSYQPLKQQDVFLFVLKKSVTFGKKNFSQISLTLPKDDNTSTEDWIALIQEAFGTNLPITRIYHPQHPNMASQSSSSPPPFVSFQDANNSSTSAGMPFLACYHGVRDGVLFPLQEGVLFTKPPTFWPRSTFTSIACGRGTNSNASRYVDLVIQLEETQEDDKSSLLLEFTNISRQEQPCLNDYIHKVLIPAMKRDAGGKEDDDHDDDAAEDVSVVEEVQDDDETEEEENNDDDDEEASSSDGGRKRRRRTKRKAATAAREATRSDMNNLGDDEEDDDEAFQMSKSRPEEEDDDDEEEEMGSDDDDDDEEEFVEGDEEHDDEDTAADAEVVDDGDATESEEDDEPSPPPSKKAKQMDRFTKML